jgi:hypothetical protein
LKVVLTHHKTRIPITVSLMLVGVCLACLGTSPRLGVEARRQKAGQDLGLLETQEKVSAYACYRCALAPRTRRPRTPQCLEKIRIDPLCEVLVKEKDLSVHVNVCWFVCARKEPCLMY